MQRPELTRLEFFQENRKVEDGPGLLAKGGDSGVRTGSTAVLRRPEGGHLSIRGAEEPAEKLCEGDQGREILEEIQQFVMTRCAAWPWRREAEPGWGTELVE